MSMAGALRPMRFASSRAEGRADGRRRQPVFCQPVPIARRRVGERSRVSVRSGGPRAYRPSRSGAAAMARMAVPLGYGGSTKARRGQGRDAPGRRARGSFAGSLLLADDGAWRRHLGAERGLSAQRAADPGQLCAAVRPSGTVRPGGSGGDLLRGAGPARPVLLRAARSDGKRHRAAAGARTGEPRPRSGPLARGLARGIRQGAGRRYPACARSDY